jgi:hypothetical protein
MSHVHVPIDAQARPVVTATASSYSVVGRRAWDVGHVGQWGVGRRGATGD